MSRPLPSSNSINRSHDRLIQLVTPWIEPLGYRVIHVEIQTHIQKVLRIFIEHLDLTLGLIGIEDCVKVSHAINEQVELLPEIDNLFPSGFDLEVSSPGLDRPLRTEQDFKRFLGKRARIHTFRPLTAAEADNPIYVEKNPKQKNFLGQLSKVEGDLVMISVGGQKTGDIAVAIPLSLISKANLEPEINFERSDERE